MEESIYSHIADGINSAVSRRKFLQLGAVGTGTIIGGSMLSRLQAMAAPPVGANDGIVVFIYLAGGNDPLNTLVPYTDDLYRNARPNLRMELDNADPLRKCVALEGTNYALHPALANIHAMYDAGKVNLIPGVGFPGQGLSHFTSLDQYNQGWAGEDIKNTGWIGRFLDTLPDAAVQHSRAITINGVRPPALVGNKALPLSLPTYIGNAYYGAPLSKKPDQQKHVECSAGSFNNWPKGPENSMAGMISKTLKDVITVPDTYRPGYDNLIQSATPTAVETNLAVCAGVINANLGARVFHLDHGSFDTHGEQLKNQNMYLSQLDNAIATFFKNLSPTFANRVTVVAYSEMGRRIQENGTGTDHGSAGMMMMIGNKVKGGIGTPVPSIDNPDSNGNLEVTTDYRQVYAEILSDWYRTDPGAILGKSYSKIGLFHGGPTL